MSKHKVLYFSGSSESEKIHQIEQIIKIMQERSPAFAEKVKQAYPKGMGHYFKVMYLDELVKRHDKLLIEAADEYLNAGNLQYGRRSHSQEWEIKEIEGNRYSIVSVDSDGVDEKVIDCSSLIHDASKQTEGI